MAPQHFKWPLTAGLAASFAGARVLWSLTGGNESRLAEFVPLTCPVLHFLGLRCPTCGFGRSAFLAFNGDLAGALEFHFLGPLALLTLVSITLLAWITPQRLVDILRKTKLLLTRPPVYWGLISTYCLWGMLRP